MECWHLHSSIGVLLSGSVAEQKLLNSDIMLLMHLIAQLGVALNRAILLEQQYWTHHIMNWQDAKVTIQYAASSIHEGHLTPLTGREPQKVLQPARPCA